MGSNDRVRKVAEAGSIIRRVCSKVICAASLAVRAAASSSRLREFIQLSAIRTAATRKIAATARPAMSRRTGQPRKRRAPFPILHTLAGAMRQDCAPPHGDWIGEADRRG
ncbi:Uncharacterised protein [Bordetella pertussis]|nr:Uncharacterised protein [Bordetella pertussis]CFW10875.1 Uncharacterised protein [Bordetella pertussis]